MPTNLKTWIRRIQKRRQLRRKLRFEIGMIKIGIEFYDRRVATDALTRAFEYKKQLLNSNAN